MNAIHRRGACPALSAPMRTGDGLLVRLNTVAGGFTPNQLIRLCQSALRHGNGMVEVTARGSLQIRGLGDDSAPMLAAEVDALGIAVRTGVPVETGPLAGLDPDEIGDPRPLAAMIREATMSADLAARLGPKVSVVIDGGGCLGMHGVAADIRLTAERADYGASAPVRWRISLAGHATAALRLAGLDEQTACAAVLALLDAVAELGIETRARDLNANLIAQAQRCVSGQNASPASVLLRADGRPSRDGHLAFACLKPEVSGRTSAASPAPSLSAPIHLTDSRHAIAVALPYGSAGAASLIDLLRAAETLGISEIRLAPQRRLIFIARDEAACLDLRQDAAALGFITQPRDPRLSISACPGSPACASGHLAARDIAQALAAAAGDALDGSLSVHISGCAKGCASPAATSLTLVGGENGAGLVVGGTAGSNPVAYATRSDTPRRAAATLALVADSRRIGETSAACAARLGADRLAAAFQQG